MIVGAFTQIVWKETEQIGITFRCKKNQYIVLAVYNPIGNIPRSYTLNVQRPISSRGAILAIGDEVELLFYQTGDYIHFNKLN